MHALCGTCAQAAQPPYDYVVWQKLLIDLPFMPAEQHLSKLTASPFNTLKMQLAIQNILVIAMQNENKANCNENFRICAEESVGPLCKQQTSLGL